MRCPVHHIEGCDCAYAARFHEEMLRTGEVPPRHDSSLTPRQPKRVPLFVAAIAAGLLACGPRPDVCSERDATLIANEAACLAQAHSKCAGIPLDEPCPFENECAAFTRERCK